MLLPSMVRGRPRVAGLLAAVTMVTALASAADFGGKGVLTILGGALLVALSLGFARAPGPRLKRFAPAASAAIWTGLALFAPAKARATTEHYLAFGEGRPLGSGWAALEELPEDSRVAVLSHDPSSHALYRPLYGHRLQLQPVAVLWNGAARSALHLSWREEPDGWWWEFEAMGGGVSLLMLVANLRAAGVEYLLVSRWPRGPEPAPGHVVLWPSVHRIFSDRLDPRRRLFFDDYSELWDLRAALSEGERRTLR